jgi:DNA/RNA-binding domain of Phe-tRNA-synthetase-like protein
VFQVSNTWRDTFPKAHAGVLVICDVTNPPQHVELEKRKAALEEQLRSHYSSQDRAALQQLPVLQAYSAYYRRFKKTYHVQLQLESIVFKDKAIPSVSALVEAMFMAEVSNLLLTAGHDLDALRLPITLEVAQGHESYLVLRGQEQPLKAGDMFMRDSVGVISSILYGPDQRTQITAQTQNAMFTVYAPAGIDAQQVGDHLMDIQRYVELFAPAARVELLKVFSAQSQESP